MAPTLVQSSVLSLLAISAASAASFNHAYLHNRGVHLQHRQTAAPVEGWEDLGCYTDYPSSRTLSKFSTTSENNTAESCIAYCAAQNMPLAGTEYSRECYCSDKMTKSGKSVSSSYCNMQCSGDSNMCGGNGYLQIFHLTSDKQATVPPAINAGPAGWGYQGCFVDSVQNRLLPYGAAVPGGPSKMSVSGCTAECQQQGYQIAGLEYSAECYCGTSLPASALAPDGETGCNMVCNGNSSELCGGANRIQAYAAGQRSTIAPAWTSLGCYTDSVQSRTLTYMGFPDGGASNMTVEGCTSTCQEMGYEISGLEYGQECWCDNKIATSGTKADDSDCNMACRGDGSQLCGSGDRLNLYQFYNASAPVVPASSTTTTTSTGTATSATSVTSTATSIGFSNSTTTARSTTVMTTTTTSTSIPRPTGYNGNWTYQGCYVDNANGRILQQFPDNATVDGCIAFCNSQGYTVAGLEYYTQCFCGSYLQNGAVLAKSETECNTPCTGNQATMCGGPDRMSIYSAATNVTTYPVPSAQNSSLPETWSYQGCLSEKQDGRVFNWMFIDDNHMNVTGCLTQCGKYGYSAAAIEYGVQCFCGDDWDRTSAGVQYISESSCSMSCPGAPSSLCGGPNALQYYTSTNIPQWSQGVGDTAGLYEYLINSPCIPLITQVGVNGKVYFTEKHGTGVNGTGAYELDMTLVDQGMDVAFRTLNGLKTDVFCSAGATMPDKAGRLLNVGGWSTDSLFGVRMLWPDGEQGQPSVNDWQENFQEVSLQVGRWYPTSLMLPNGSYLIVGGEDGSNGPPVPNSEILPRPAGGYLKYHDWLERTDPNNLYPFLFVLPSGNIAVFYFNEAIIIDEDTLDVVKELPYMPGNVAKPGQDGRTYPLEGSAMSLPQVYPYTDPLEVLICGGSTIGAGEALDNCIRIKPEVANATWEIERMPDRRVMTCMVSLPDTTYLIMNGARQGFAGFGLASDSGLMAMSYDPRKPHNQRFTRLANTTIARMYHSEAILLLDGTVLVSGSDPEEGANFVHPQEYRVERFTPPYLMGNRAASRPAYTIEENDWAYGQDYQIQVTSGDVASVSLMGSVASTHGHSMGQKILVPKLSCAGSTCTIQAPPDAWTSPPGWFMLFAMNAEGTPSIAQWVRIGGDPASLGNWPQFPDFTVPGL